MGVSRSRDRGFTFTFGTGGFLGVHVHACAGDGGFVIGFGWVCYRIRILMYLACILYVS